jgi:tetratricopeptide (TPR) repeat protein
VFILQICEFLDDGDGFYRLHEPSRQLARLPGVVVVDCHFYHRLLPSLVRSADVVILPFLHDWDLFPVLEERRTAGHVTVFEANDYFYDIQPWNPVAVAWQDRATQGQYRHYMAETDAVQTSTDELGRRWRPWARRIAIFPNQLTDVPPLLPLPERPLTIGWGGSPGHFADWYHLVPALESWLAAHPQVHLAVMTHEFARPFFRLPPERYHFTPFGTLPDYFRFLGTLDIGLAPLLPTEYNRCRSDVKLLEYAAHGVAGIYADLEPYRDVVVHGQTGLLYQTEAELLRHLDALAADAALRQRLRTQAHRYVSEQRRLPQHIGERLAFYRELLPEPSSARDSSPGEEVFAAAVRDGNYLQLRPQQSERVLLACLEKPVTREKTAQLARLVEHVPDYFAALLHLGRLLNDLRDNTAALPYLQRACALHPRSAAALSELGRTHFLLDDVGSARQALEAALAVNPWHFPAWSYLLRLLHLAGSAEGAPWAERARRMHPDNFHLALLGARTYPGPEAVGVLQRLLEEFAPTLQPHETSAAALAFDEAIRDVIRPLSLTSDVLALLRHACAVFPQSARLADMFGHALHHAGRHAESRTHLARALDLRRAALTFRAEYPEDDGTLHYWQFAEHIRRALARTPAPRTPTP